MRVTTTGLAVALALTASAAFAEISDAQVQAGYEAAIDARMAFEPERAEAILEELVAARPNAPQLRFDLAVSQAEQGQCAKAARTFSRGEDLAQTPSFARAAEVAMADLCPRLAPWESSLGFTLGYDSNINGGATTRDIMVGGVPVRLSDDAMAQGAWGYTLSGGLAYNHQLSHTTYLVPNASLSFSDYEGEEFDRLSLTTGVAFRHRGDAVDWRIGPSFKWSFDHEGLLDSGPGIAGRLSWEITPKSGLYANASAYWIENERNPLNSYDEIGLGATYVRALDRRNMVARAGVSVLLRDYENDLQDLDSYTAEIGLSGSLTEQIGFDLALSHTVNEGRAVHPFFGERRSDDVTTLSAQASFAQLEGWYGRPYLGVRHTISESSFDSKDFERSSIVFGLTRSF